VIERFPLYPFKETAMEILPIAVGWLALVCAAGLASTAAAALPCGTGTPIIFRAGVADEFAAPADPTSRGAALNAAFPSARWKDFDDRASNHFVGHTFTGLPAGIVRAELELRLLPHADVPDNDAVDIGLLPGARFAKAVPIATLPDARGTWDPDHNSPTTFNVPLGPADAALLAQMSAQQILDVLVQDDSAVDFMKLKVWSCPAPVFSTGLPYLPLGDATIASVFEQGPIVVSNTGPRFGGVELLPASQIGLCVSLLEAVCMGVGTAMELTVPGSSNGLVSANHLKLTYNPQTNRVDITADFSPYGNCNKAQVLNGTTFVAGGFCQSRSQVVASVPPGTCIKEIDWIVFNDFTRGFSLLLEPGANVTLSGFTTFFGNRINILPDIITGGADDGYGKFRLSKLDLQTTGVPSFTVDAALVQSFGLFHRALGKATFQGADSGLTLSTPSLDGGDGVAIDLKQSTAASVSFAPLDPLGVAQDGAFLQADLTGSVNGRPGQPLGTLKSVLRVQSGLAELEMTPDFTALGAPAHRVEVYDHGARVASAGGQAGRVVLDGNVVVIWPLTLAVLPGGGFSLSWASSGVFSIPGGATVTGDELRLVPEPGSSITIDNLTGLALHVASLPELTLADVRTTSCQIPVISRQPAGVSTAAGRPAVFSVAAEGAGPLTYRWRRNGVDLAEGNRSSGTATSMLTLSPTILAQAGTYDVVIANTCGSVVSAPAVYAPGVALRSLLLSLLSNVQSLVGSGTLSSQQGAGLSASLLHALDFLRVGNLPAAANRLDVFIARVNAFVRANTFSPSQGKALTDAALAARMRLAG
jgi:hypothetical protein